MEDMLKVRMEEIQMIRAMNRSLEKQVKSLKERNAELEARLAANQKMRRLYNEQNSWGIGDANTNRERATT